MADIVKEKGGQTAELNPVRGTREEIRTKSVWGLRSLGLLAVLAFGRGEARGEPNCDQEPQPPVCECRGRRGPALARCLLCANEPEREECKPKPPISGTLNPSYLIVAIVYSPPGAGPGGTRSSVAYTTESSLGTAVNIEKAFNAELDFSATTSFLGLLKSGISGGFISGLSDGHSIEIKKTTANTITVWGGSSDGINHDYDRFYLWLNPKVAVVVHGDNAKWALGTEGTAMLLQWVTVGQLKNPATMSEGLARQLRGAGIKPEDYGQILSQNPFTNGSATIDVSRYKQLDLIYPYEPVPDPGGPEGAITTQITNSLSSGTLFTSISSYSVGYSVKSGPFAEWLGAELETSGKFTWTHTSTFSTNKDQSQSATLTIGSPSPGYTGSTAMAVYWDTLYGTFMFAPAPVPQPTAVGTVTDARGKPAPHKEVWLTIGRKHWRTFSNHKGEYKFFATPKGIGFIEVAGTPRQRVSLRDARTDLGVYKLVR